MPHSAISAENSRSHLICLAFSGLHPRPCCEAVHVHVEEPNLSHSEQQAAANRLRDAVRHAGGNESVSQRSGVALRTLSAYLAGGEMKVSNLIRLARACGVSMEWIATGAGPLPRWLRKDVGPGLHSAERQEPLAPPAIDVQWLAKAIEIVEALGGEKLPVRERARRIAQSYELLTTPDGDIPDLPTLPRRPG